MDSSSVASSVVVMWELLEAERFLRPDILRKKLLLLLLEPRSGERVADEEVEAGGDWCC